MPVPKSTRTKQVEEIAKGNRYFEQTEAYEIAAEADKFHSLKTLLDQEGGRILLDHYIKKTVGGVDQLSGYADMPHEKLIALCAFITTNLESARALARAGDNLAMADEALEEALRE